MSLSLRFFSLSLSLSISAHSSSHRAGSIKSSRRSSYLLAITTERSKSCDEGLNTFREEGRVFSWVLSNWDSWLFIGLKLQLLNYMCSQTFWQLTLSCVSVLHRRLPKRVKSFFTDGVSSSPLINKHRVTNSSNFSTSKPYFFINHVLQCLFTRSGSLQY